MAKYQYGCSKVEHGTMDKVTGEITWAPAELEVYQDTIVIDQPEASKTDHYKQGSSNPAVSRYAKVAKTIAFSIMDLSADSKVLWLGGTKTTVATKDTWNEPEKAVPATIKALRFTLEDESVIVVPVAECAARLTGNVNDTDIVTIPVVATVKSTGVSSVSSFQWTD